MKKRMCARRNLAGLVIAVVAAFCMAGSLALTAFAQPQPTSDGQSPAGEGAGLAVQSEGDVSYIERSWNEGAVAEETKTIASSSFNKLPTTGTMWFGTNEDNWYVVSEDTTISSRITVNGTVNLILCDGATLTMSKGIAVENASTLNIYPGSTEGAVEGTGKLFAGCQLDGDNLTVSCENSSAGIGGDAGNNGGTVTIHGGTVTATGKAAGIGGGGSGSSGFGGNGGAVTVYGGTVTATGSYGAAGIGGGFQGSGGAVTVYGGTATATGGTSAAGIGGGRWGNGGTVSVYGGDVTATGGDSAAGIGGGDVRDLSDTSIGAGGNVSVYGGTVTATGGNFGVGIGCGAGSTGSSGDITLGDRVTLKTSSDGETWSEPTTETNTRTQFMKVVYTPPVSYQAWNESSQKVENVAGGCAESTEVTSTTEAFENGAWYVVSGDVSIGSRITIGGTAHLILCDGATLTASKGITVADDSTLNIYAQSAGANKGRLIAGASSNGCDEGCAGIGGVSGGAGGTVTIHGGAVTAIGGAGAAGIGGGSGGAGGTVTLYGDTVNTAGGEGAKGIGAGSGGSSDGTFNPVGADVFTSNDNAEWAAYSSETGSKRYMRTLDTYFITLSGGANATVSGGELTQSVTEGASMAPATFTVNDGYCFPETDGAYGNHDGVAVEVSDDKTTITVSGTPTADASITIPDAVPVPVTYQAWDENAKEMKSVELGGNDYNVVDAGTKSLTSDKPYVVSGNVTISDRITVGGTAHLILRDGATLTASKGITVANGNTLNIYAQSTGADKGQLIAGDSNDGCAEHHAGIGGGADENSKDCGTVNIHGGNVKATGGINGAGIGSGYEGMGGTVAIYGGTVTAAGGEFSAGIGSGDNGTGGNRYEAGAINVYGGSVKATGSNWAAGIGGGRNGSGGVVAIHGGVVTATGGDGGAGIGGGENALEGRQRDGGSVTVNGGTVEATGGNNAAGIGGGNGGHGGTVTVNGGTVEATGSNWAAGIGGGARGNGANVTINGGTVKATGSQGNSGTNAVGIGGGDWSSSYTTSPGTLNLGQAMALYGGDSSEAKALLAADQGSYEGTRYKYMEIAAATGVQPVPYQAWDEGSGAMKSVEGGRASYTVMDSNTTAFKDGKWYVVNSDVTVPERITVTGEANLILCDSATLTASKGVYVPFSDEDNDDESDNVLNIYAQSNGASMGTMTATGDMWAAGIGGINNNGGTANIHGGAVSATGGQGAAGIGGGSGGAGGAITIFGGAVTATGTGLAAGIGGGNEGNGGPVAIYGGFVNAAGGDSGAMGIGGGVGHGDSNTNNGTLTLADTAEPLVVSSNNKNWSAYDRTADTRMQYMKSAEPVSITIAANTDDGHLTVSNDELMQQTVAEGASIADVVFTAATGYCFPATDDAYGDNNGVKVEVSQDKKTITVSGALTANTEITIPDAVPAPVKYKVWDEADEIDLGSNYYVVDANTKKLASDKPNVVNSNVTISDRIALQGESATLIICDGATLTASQGIDLASVDTLNIYSGSTGDRVEGTGTLKATGSDNAAGIGGGDGGFGGGKIFIHGGNVEAEGGTNAAGIGGGNGSNNAGTAGNGFEVTVYGGTVKATGGANAVGIGTGYKGGSHGTLTLNDMALYGGESAETKALIAGSLNGGYGGNRYTYMEIGAAVPVDPVLYKAWDEENKTTLNVEPGCTSYIAMNANTTTLGGDNWYVVNSDVAVPGRITVDGTAHLIICDDATLTVSKGIDITGATLNIYPGTTGDRVAGTGKLIAGASSGGCDDRVAAIGSDSADNAGTLNIHGGDVTTIGGKEAAGIGGGYHCDGGTINVYSGTVTATGGEKAAGIGGGNQGGGGAISILGGDVIAAGGTNAAGIGGGNGGAGGTVSIRNSDVTAVGGQGAAGIGGGSASAGGTVTIYNSVVGATGGQGAAGIGGGSAGDGGTVTIHSGTVTTAAGQGAEGIGSGDGLGAHGSLTLDAGLALYGGSAPDPTALAEKSVIESITHYERSRYMTALDAVKGIRAAVDKLPAFDKVTTADKKAIANARTAYNELTASQKANVAAETLKKLEAAENKIVILQAMSEVAAKTGNGLIYTGRPLQLINAPTTKLPAGYTMKYAVTTGNKAPTNESAYAASIPTATNAGTYYVWRKVVGSANNTAGGPASTSTTISKASISKATVAAAAQVYTGKALTPTPTVKLGATTLKQGTDYTTSYKNNVKIGKATVTVTGKGNYAGTISATFAIASASIAKTTVKLPRASYNYTGKALKPAPTVALGGKALTAGTDYTVSYKNNVKAGKATITVTGKGNYAGTKAATFTINKAANKLTVKTAKKTVKASKKAQKVKCFKKAKPKFKAKVTYKKATTAKAKKLNGYKKKVLSVNKKTGKITVKKNAKPGTYKLMVKVTAAKTANTKAVSKTVTVTVKVKGKAAKKSLKSQSARPADSSLRAASL